MKIYGVSQGDYDDWHVTEYFEDQATAEQYRDVLNANPEVNGLGVNDEIIEIELRGKDFKLVPCEYVEISIHMPTRIPGEAEVTEFVSTIFAHMQKPKYEIYHDVINKTHHAVKRYNGVHITAQGTDVADIRATVKLLKTQSVENFDTYMQQAADEPTRSKRLVALRADHNEEDI